MRDKPSEPAEFDVYATDYDRAVNAATAFTGLKVDLFTHVKADYLRDILATSFVNSAAVDMLDIGCGTGNIHRHIQGHVRSLSGTDVSATSIGVAQQCNPGVTYKVYDGERLPWPDHSFDLAFAICVLHPPCRRSSGLGSSPKCGACCGPAAWRWCSSTIPGTH